MKAIILAGGYGTRLRAATGDEVPKCMAKGWFKPGHRKVPWLTIVVQSLKAEGITDITLALHYKPQAFIDYYGDRLKYRIEEEKLGTGGAIRNCLEAWPSDGDPVLALNGDTLADMSYAEMRRQYRSPLTVARTLDGVSAGVYIFDPALFNFWPKAFSLEHDMIPQVTSWSYPIASFVDMGTPEGYARAQT